MEEKLIAVAKVYPSMYEGMKNYFIGINCPYVNGMRQNMFNEINNACNAGCNGIGEQFLQNSDNLYATLLGRVNSPPPPPPPPPMYTKCMQCLLGKEMEEVNISHRLHSSLQYDAEEPLDVKCVI